MQTWRLWILSVWGMLWAFPLWAQQPPPEPEEPPPPAEQEAAAPSGGGARPGSSDWLMSFGALYTLSISESSETKAGTKSAIMPRGRIKFGFLQGEVMLSVFQVQGKGGLSTGGIAESDLTFSGQSYSLLGVWESESWEYYGGYGINSYKVSQSLSTKISQQASAANLTFDQDVKAKSGSELILGLNWLLAESVMVGTEYRIITIPVDVKTTLSGSQTASVTKAIDLGINVLALGVSYYF